LERADVLAVLGGCVVVLALIGLGFYAVRKMNPDSLRVRTSLMRMFSFSIEIGPPGNEKQGRELD
jgi:flagellar biogenesis protein FliO